MKGGLRIDQRRLQPSKRIGKGGEGEVWALGDDPAHAIKIYTVSNPASLEPKIRAMIHAQLAQHAPQIAFPLAVVTTQEGRFAGFLMKLVREHKPLHELYSPGSRKIHFPEANYRFLVRTALNIAKAVGSVHQIGCVIGDINHSSVLVGSKATVTLIDSDSFQVTNNSHKFLCRVGVPEYTAPELQGMSLGSVVRTINHDAFGLAVVIFQLLFMGRHPFMGTVRRGESPPLPQSIKDVRFVYSENRDVGMDQPPGTPTLSDFPSSIGESFESAFSEQLGRSRPSASQWIRALEELEKDLVQCSDERLHWYPQDATECPWCEMDRELGVSLFIPYVPQVTINDAIFDPGANGFNLESVWHQIAATGYLDRSQVTPILPPTSTTPSSAIKTLELKKRLKLGSRLGIAGLAVGLFFYAPDLWAIWVIVGGAAIYSAIKKTSIDPEPLLRRYAQAEQEWNSALSAWLGRIEVNAAADLYQSLLKAKSEYENLPKEDRELRRAYADQRRVKQLHAHLDKFEIRTARIKGVGPAKLAALLSYGIETAADIQRAKVLAVPGFGPTNSQGLLQWRQRLESRFVYSEQQNETDRQELAKISARIQTKASKLRRTLLAGASNLSNLISRTKTLAAAKDNQLARINATRAQLLVDLESLGVTKSTLDQRVAQGMVIPSPAPQARPSPTFTATPTPRVSCPRCGSAMVRRTARRGRNAGNQFWGCSRYPLCKGTRN